MTAGGGRPIGGSTRLFAVLGDPVAQVRAPALVNPLFAELGLDAVLVPVHVRPGDLAAVVRGLEAVRNLDGLLVTVPHKFAVCGLAAELGRAAELAGSANALRRRPANGDGEAGGWLADNFDGAGFVAGLEHAGHPVAGRRFVLAGAGGAGTAIATALLQAGAGRLTVCEPDTARLGGLLDRLERHWPGRARGSAVPLLDGAEVAVNATPLGLRAGDPLPFSPAELPPGCVVADIVMTPPMTPLLRAAAERGHPVHHGRHMLDQQLSLYRGFFGL
ncbi:shikimate dehydrogenase family protein [Actinomadura rubrisoli]|uniref:Shikimate dehydrogenase n=1 Tax=Actinomadura rubrisoli TaxID=2530368 RepID=A0A4R5B7X6_9ACTN|nr:shikimate dehydrogenase [Actinomadura rubrisoli]TDD81059.1 shikimate dehydrogenase [Actinomadura rubrisoli]